MATLTLDAPGAERLADTLDDAAGQLLDVAAHQDAGQLVLGSAEPPVRTGALAAGLGVTADQAGFTLTSDQRYAPFVHARNPFFTDAIARRQEAIADVYEQHLVDALGVVRGD